ncbi:MAG: sirohydrochlorin cobaltochelatase [Desulfovibrio sp.]|nr:sirohydrochlorin cobaltochelatase [Desulfovibrio sp.]
MRKAILLVAYGAENNMAKDGLAIFERACRERFPGVPLRWAYSSPLVRNRIALRGRKSDSLGKALRRLYYEKHDAIAIQPLQVIAGREYEAIGEDAREFMAESGAKVATGSPLMLEDADAEILARALIADMPENRAPDEAVVYMGHGAKHANSRFYNILAQKTLEKDVGAFVSSMNGDLDAVLNRVNSHKIWLAPLFANIGRHALEDMAGDKPESWLSRIRGAGFECVPYLRGLASGENVAGIWLKCLARALGELEKRGAAEIKY